MHNVIGKRVKRIDGYEKVTGKGLYGDDLHFHGMLHAACRYTDIPCGKIVRVDTSKAESMDGVEAIAMYNDVPGDKRVGPIRADQYPLVNDEVFYSGDVIAIVAATTRAIAQTAAEAIEVEYQPMEGIFEVEDALKPNARLIHPEFQSNLVVHYPVMKGDVEQGFAESDHVIERTYRTGFHEHAYLEPETVMAVPDWTTGGYRLYGSLQNPYLSREAVALFMGIGLNKINVMPSILGGSFGGKDDIIHVMSCRVTLLARMTGRPVKLTYTREESLKESYKRHPYIMTYKVGFTKNGRLKAMKIDVLADSGAYSSQTFFVTWRSVVQATGPYNIEHVRTDVRGVYTNNTYTAAFRGFGAPQVIFAQESLMDEIADVCGMTPLEIRRKNAFKQGSVTATGQKLSGHQVAVRQVIDEAVKKADYEKKRAEFEKLNQTSERFKYGIGLSASLRGCSLGAEGTDVSSAIVSVQADGSVYVMTGVTENGQGLQTTFCQVVSEILGIDQDHIVFLRPQTTSIADGGPTVASRGTIVGGNATIDAAHIIKERIFSMIKEDLHVSKLEETEWQDGYISCKTPTSDVNPIRFEEAVGKAFRAGLNLSAYGWFKSPEVSWNEETGQGNAYFTYVYGCQIAEIKVDSHTGKIEVLNVTAAHDVGKVINRLGAEGQVYGGVMQGIGYAIFEDYDIQQGVVKSANFDTYLIPTVKDAQHIDPVFVENPDKRGPFGAKSLGEPTLELTAAAINNALSFAVGERSYQMPLTLEQVFLGKNLRKPARQSEVAHGDSCKIDRPVHGGRKTTHRVSDVTMQNPANLEEALKLLAEDSHNIISGGTDVVIQARLSNEPLSLVYIGTLPELKGITDREDEIEIGGAETFSSIIRHKLLQRHFPLFVEACRLIGSTQIRNRGTLGGNLVNAAPCADSLPPLIAYGAKIHLQSQNGRRDIDAAEFMLKQYQTQIQPGEILVAITIPKPAKTYYHSYFQLGRRNAMNITRLSVSAKIAFDDAGNVEECSLVDGAMFSRPQRLRTVEESLLGKPLDEEAIASTNAPLEEKIEAEIGTRWSAVYKKPVFINLCQDVLRDIQQQVK